MKLRTKIITVFILSIIISLIVFVIATAYQLRYGSWSGISEYEMTKAATGAAGDISTQNAYDERKVAPIFKKWGKAGMQMELLSKKLQILYSNSGRKGEYTLGELGERLSHHVVFKQKEWVVLRAVVTGGKETGYVLVSVSQEHYLSIAIGLNNKGAGILGKIFLIGTGITLLVSTIFAILFTIRISRRFSHLSRGIGSFELGNLEVVIPDKSKDEIGKLTATFNSMAIKIKNQVDQEKEFQEQRRQLVSNLSHDLRTPLTTIVGYSESLDNGIYEDEEERKKYINLILKASLYMEKLMDELLELSRMESANFELNLKEDDLSELSREILIEYIPQLQEKGIQLNAEIPENPVVINIDKDRISRVLRNILENSIKYGGQGKYIGFIVKDFNEEVCISIQDKGQGIDSENIKKIFDRFFRVDKARNSKDGGMGLGLAIAQEIVKKHGGKIEVQSEKDKGATFVITLFK